MGDLGRVLVVADDRTLSMRTVTEATATRLAARSASVTTIGLADFAPAMSSDERNAYESEAPILDPVIADAANRVRQSDTIVFITPTDSNGLSAPTKGWLDRVLVPGVAFVLDERSGRVRPALGNIRMLGLVTVDDRSLGRRFYEHDNARRVIFRALRLVCGLRTRTRAIRLTRAAIDGARLDKRLSRIERW